MSKAVLDELDALFAEAKSSVEKAKSEQELEETRIHLLGKKGKLTSFLRNLSTLPAEERPSVGKRVNEIKESVEEILRQHETEFKKHSLLQKLETEKLDLTLPGEPVPLGRIHPISAVLRDIKEIFGGMGFQVVPGPEIESDYYNFEALNIPTDHPSRDMWDSFYLAEKTLLRTHTSPVQIRVMEKQKPPLRAISGGKCYRRDSVDATHCFQFHQVEGFMVDEGVTFADLKGVLSTFARAIFGAERQVKFVPSYFPFTEPSVEVHIDCFKCAENSTSSCPICGGGKWLEILGGGMIHPYLMKIVNYSEHYSGFAFGMGVERIAMLKYGIDDIRLFYESQSRFLREF